MAKKLYRVTVEIELMVLAENEPRAEEIARDNYKEEDPYFGASVFATEVKSLKELTSDDLGSLPWGDKSDKSVREWWAELHPSSPPTPETP